ncbi:HD family hydrolase [uncultured Roseibium sp.]|uniref:HD domain-containing protein n=1 Tax=uncultured Roseibium sp. TaxID=1936171 RepID=UPI0026167DE4|nr:HD domain-containing protein [uncultured Roseibium sp.]
MTKSDLATTPAAIPHQRLEGILAFLQESEKLKDTLRSGTTRQGRPESTAEHSWRLSLMVLLFERELAGIDLLKLVKLCLVHDLGEAISGDVPAPLQQEGDDREERERRDFLILCRELPDEIGQDLLALWDEYAQAETPEAQLAKAFDKLETILQHQLMPPQSVEFHEFNMTYGRSRTDVSALTSQIRDYVDRNTQDIISALNDGAA